MRECRTYGSVRGALSDERPYRDRVPVVRAGPVTGRTGLGWRAVPPLLRFLAGLTLWLCRTTPAWRISPRIAALFRDAGVAPGRVLPIPNGVDTTASSRRTRPRCRGCAPNSACPGPAGPPLHGPAGAGAKGLLTLAEASRGWPSGPPTPVVLLGTGEGSVGRLRGRAAAAGGGAASRRLAGAARLGRGPSAVAEAADLFVFPSEFTRGSGSSSWRRWRRGCRRRHAGRRGARGGAGRRERLARAGRRCRAALGRARGRAGRPDVWRSMGSAGRAAVVDRFGMEGVLDRYVDLLVHLTPVAQSGRLAERWSIRPWCRLR